MTQSNGVSAVSNADESFPAKGANVSTRETLAPWQASTLRAYVASHLHSTIRVMDLVRTVQMAPNRFFRVFKKSFDCTPHQYVMRTRIARAQRLLLVSEDTLQKIAAQCGFGNKSHLANLFREATGRSPGQWRRIHATPPGMRPMSSSAQRKHISSRVVLPDRLPRQRGISKARIFANGAKTNSVYGASVSAGLGKSVGTQPNEELKQWSNF
jgi:AraC-like DNA-binding protein